MKSENSVFSAIIVPEIELYDTAFKYPSFNYFDIFKQTDDTPFILQTNDNTTITSSSFSPRKYSFTYGRDNDLERNMQIMQGLTALMNTIPSLKDTFIVTSFYRPGAKTKQGNDSWHGKGLAIDIVPKDGDFAKLERNIMQSPQVVQYLLSNGLGILDEYSKNGYQKQVGATGNNMHIGKDKLALAGLSKLMKQYGYEIT